MCSCNCVRRRLSLVRFSALLLVDCLGLHCSATSLLRGRLLATDHVRSQRCCSSQLTKRTRPSLCVFTRFSRDHDSDTVWINRGCRFICVCFIRLFSLHELARGDRLLSLHELARGDVPCHYTIRLVMIAPCPLPLHDTGSWWLSISTVMRLARCSARVCIVSCGTQYLRLFVSLDSFWWLVSLTP
jgi:hypothetical protein